MIEHLEHIRGKVDEIGDKVSGVEGRMADIETDFLRLAKNEAGRNLDIEAIVKRVDKLETRLARLESRSRSEN